MNTIALDSSTDVCSAALLRDGEVVAERLNLIGSNHAALLATYVQELLAEAKERGMTVEGIVLSEGPGSYTGLRIGASLAKGLCYGADIPLLAVPTLAVIASAAIRSQQSAVSNQSSALICPMIDARRMEVYCALYDTSLGLFQPLSPIIINEQSFADVLEKHVLYFCGNGAEKCKQVIRHPNARWIDGIVPTGAEAGRLADEWMKGLGDERLNGQMKILKGKDIAYFEPNYLKDFIAAPSHIKGLH
ncbi:MAG: tRNA (adenosine(37)-N6)-threonylcarbamoyltransferase complex dimerization subunit type 1 TsaB [Paludibacteraceae bacterium]|nr:tRNA (adenosine(37)-N6)-threonylcarbamoyltransferase complex dimerization subunit type 1 TsaB [Paludibacteraceae bacterium]